MNTIKSITAESIQCFVALYIFISICLEIDTVPHILLTSLLRVDLQITLAGHPIMRPPLLSSHSSSGGSCCFDSCTPGLAACLE